MSYDTPINATDSTFQRAVLQPATPVIAVFWSAQLTPRHELNAVLEQAARSYAGEVLIVELESEDVPAAMARYNVDRLPQFLFFRGGRLIARASGMPSMAALRPWVEYLLNRGPRPTRKSPPSSHRAASDGRPLVLTDADFDRVVLNADVPVLVDFWAPWCGACRSLAPAIDELARSFSGRVLVAKIDIDANEAVAREYGVMSIPTVIFFHRGREVDRVVGAQPRHVLEQKVEAML